jgi:uncharacterized membrane protein
MRERRKPSVHQSLKADPRDVSRIESFSDGIFAIAGTLLVLDLRVPDLQDPTPAAVAHAIAANWTGYVAFAASFTQILIMWINHHGIFHHVNRHDPLLILANGFLLLMVTLVPWPTALVSRYLETPAASTVCAIYATTLVLINVSFNLLWLSVIYERRNLADHVTDEHARNIRNRYLSAFPVYLASIVLAFASPWLSLILSNSLWIFWVRMGRTHATLVSPPV